MTRRSGSIGTDEAVLIAGHGSRRERSNEQVRDVAATLEERIEPCVETGYIELAEPLLPEAIDELAREVDELTVVPLALFAAGHVKNDIPLVIQQARATHDDLVVHGGAPVGVAPRIVDLLDDRVSDVEAELGIDRDVDDLAVVFCARGSNDPDANGDAYKLGRLLYEGRSFSRVETTFIGITEPLLDETLEEVALDSQDAVIVVPYMLGDGVLTQRIRDWTAEFAEDRSEIAVGTTDVIGTDSRLIDVLEDRWREARSGSVQMSCATCKYKVALAGYEDEVGGEAALEHALAHQREHAHELDHGHENGDHGHDHGHDHEHGH